MKHWKKVYKFTITPYSLKPVLTSSQLRTNQNSHHKQSVLLSTGAQRGHLFRLCWSRVIDRVTIVTTHYHVCRHFHVLCILEQFERWSDKLQTFVTTWRRTNDDDSAETEPTGTSDTTNHMCQRPPLAPVLITPTECTGLLSEPLSLDRLTGVFMLRPQQHSDRCVHAPPPSSTDWQVLDCFF